jgi:hypothetical protein
VAGLVGAVIGAIIGGIASVEGSILIERWMQTRTIRVRLYGELLPEVLRIENAVPPSPEGAAPLDSLEAQARELYRAATIAGKTDQGHAKRIHSSIETLQSSYQQYQAVRAQEPRPTVFESRMEGNPLAMLPPRKAIGPEGTTYVEATWDELKKDRQRVEMETKPEHTT